jgi:F-type H+-transporting ATPase subunit b
MGQILSQLGHLFAQTIPTIIVVFFLLLVLDRIFFRPLSKTLEARARATSGALAEAREHAAAAEQKLLQYEQALQAVRQEIYRQREKSRREVMDEREGAVQKARGRAESMVKEAQDALAGELATAKADARVTVELLAKEIAELILTPGSNQGGREEAGV